MAKKAEKIRKPRILRIGSNDQAGFTLIEVLAALLILAVITGLVLPEMYRSTRGIEAKVALRQIERDLNHILQETKGTDTVAKAVFRPGTEEYQIIMGDQILERPLYGLKYEADTETQLTFGPEGKVQGGDSLKFKDALGKEFVWKAESVGGK
jgi:prepilin-type N-terminal cleavage/methylation domain-containing protein